MRTQIKQFQKENLTVRIFRDETAAGKGSAEFVANHLYDAIQATGHANLILATGTSQFAFIEAIKTFSVDWSKITVFHLDEYKDLPETHRACFRKYLRERILDEVKPHQVYYINGDAEDIEGEIARYEKRLAAATIHVACIGIGENGHIAFNDPDVADFDDPHLVKIVQLDDISRRQQLTEGWFSTLEEVPREAISLTIPAIMRCKAISCMVPEKRKADAVYNTLNAEISTACPATILRRHPHTVLFLDKNSASQLS